MLWRPCMRRLYGLYYQDLRKVGWGRASEQESLEKKDLAYLSLRLTVC